MCEDPERGMGMDSFQILQQKNSGRNNADNKAVFFPMVLAETLRESEHKRERRE